MTTNDEAILNIASIYNTTTELIVPKLKVIADTNIGGNLNVSGNFNFLPKGSVIAWYGQPAQIPTGWAICDGTNGTPNLKGRFIFGGDPTVPNLGQTGGETTHTLTINEMPVHHHNITTGTGEGCTPGGRVTQWAQCQGPYIKDDGIIKDNGGNQPHNNMPPYMVLYYIMKL
jgi:hypothetical protein